MPLPKKIKDILGPLNLIPHPEGKYSLSHYYLLISQFVCNFIIADIVIIYPSPTTKINKTQTLTKKAASS